MSMKSLKQMSTSAAIAKRRLLMVVAKDRQVDGRPFKSWDLLMFKVWDAFVLSELAE